MSYGFIKSKYEEEYLYMINKYYFYDRIIEFSKNLNNATTTTETTREEGTVHQQVYEG
jgi:hypothetical protein